MTDAISIPACYSVTQLLISHYVLLHMCYRDLRRLGELQTELAGTADFCATYLRCQLLLMKVEASV